MSYVTYPIPERGVQARRGSLAVGSMAFPVACASIFCLAAIVNSIQPVGEGLVQRATERLGPFVLLKLMVAGGAALIGGWGFLNSPRTRAILLSMPGALLSILAGLCVLTSLFAYHEVALISRGAALIFTSYLVFTCTAIGIINLRTVILSITVGTAVFLFLSWFLFFAVPSMGRFQEYTDATTSVTRLGGIAHPNLIGRNAVMVILLCAALLRSGPMRESHSLVRWGLYGLVLMSVLTIAATMSRTSMIAGFVALLALYYDRIWTREGATILCMGVVGAIGIVWAGALFSGESALFESAAVMVTKSGEVKELTSITGRTEIWQEAWSLILERPWTGWGMDSAASLMSEHSFGTHNLILHFTFSAGAFAGLLAIALVIWTLWQGLTTQEPLFRAIAAYVLLSGLVEDTLLESFPSCLTLLWIIMLVTPTMHALDLRTTSQDRENLGKHSSGLVGR